MIKLSEVKAKQPNWFSKKNKKFFGDVTYRILHGKISKKPFLVRESYTWSDMFGKPRVLTWHINELEDNLEIGSFIEKVFRNLDEVKEFLKEK